MKRRLLCAIAFSCCLAGCSAAAESSPASSAQTQASTAEQAPVSASSNSDQSAGLLSSADDVILVPTDDYARGYVFTYGDEEYVAYFDTYSWRVYDSYKIADHNDIVHICQALLNEHPVYGIDWESLRAADDMAYEWEQHNLAYRLLPEDSAWIDDVKNVDLDPYDQGKSFKEMYESRTGEAFDPGSFVEGLGE